MLAKKAFTDSAYGQARARLPLAVHQTIPRTVIKALLPETANGQRHEHRTFLIDGSSLSMPDTSKLQAHFGQARGHAPRCGIPVANMVRLMMAETASRQEAGAGRISLVDTLPWLRNSKAGDELAPLEVNPDRSGRPEPRVRKRRPKEFPVMKRPRSEWRKQLMVNTFAD